MVTIFITLNAIELDDLNTDYAVYIAYSLSVVHLNAR